MSDSTATTPTTPIPTTTTTATPTPRPAPKPSPSVADFKAYEAEAVTMLADHKGLAFAATIALALALGTWLPDPGARVVAQLLGLSLSAIAGRTYLP